MLEKLFLNLRVIGYWSKLPREAVESPSLEIQKPQLDAVAQSNLL